MTRELVTGIKFPINKVTGREFGVPGQYYITKMDDVLVVQNSKDKIIFAFSTDGKQLPRETVVAAVSKVKDRLNTEDSEKVFPYIYYKKAQTKITNTVI